MLQIAYNDLNAGTSLENLARQDWFRRLFLKAPDIGGSYSVPSGR